MPAARSLALKGAATSAAGARPESATAGRAARRSCGSGELDRVLGGGIVAGSVTLLGGDPGIGKSTLLLQVAAQVAADAPVLYASGEESVDQIGLRAERLGLETPGLRIAAESDLEGILAAASALGAALLVVDSIQTVSLSEPKMLEHLVDTVLYFESDAGSRWRIVRATKNRFGAANELAFFAMVENGLREVANPSAIFLARPEKIAPGSIVTVAREGGRPLLVEIQGLVDPMRFGNPRRVAQGLDATRLAMLLAVMNRHGGLSLQDHDVFVNVVGGLALRETASDLPMLLTLASSLRDKPLPATVVAFGEVGLTGEVRPVAFGEERLREAAKQGFRLAIVPQDNLPRRPIEGLQIRGVSGLAAALTVAFDGPG